MLAGKHQQQIAFLCVERRPLGWACPNTCICIRNPKQFEKKVNSNVRRSLQSWAKSPTSIPPQKLTAVISRSKDLEQLSNACSYNWDALNHIHISAALYTAAKLPDTRHRTADATTLLESLAKHFTRTLPTSTIREIATVLWSLAKLNQPPPYALLSHVLTAVQDRDLLSSASPQPLANILWALATWGTCGPDPLLQLLLDCCSLALPAFRPQDTSNVLWALAKLDSCGRRLYVPPQLLTDLFTTATSQSSNMTPQGLANSVWACHRLCGANRPAIATSAAKDPFPATAAATFLKMLPAASPTDVALLTASLAGLRIRCPVLLTAVAERCCADIPGSMRSECDQVWRGKDDPEPRYEEWSLFCRQRLLWAFATLKFRHQGAVRALLIGMEDKIRDQNIRLAAARSRSSNSGGDGGPKGISEPQIRNDGDGERGYSDMASRGYAEGGALALAASSLIWSLARLGGGQVLESEQRVVKVAVEQLWAVRDVAALSHVAVAAWGLEQLGLAQEWLLRMATQRLLTVLEGQQRHPSDQRRPRTTSSLGTADSHACCGEDPAGDIIREDDRCVAGLGAKGIGKAVMNPGEADPRVHLDRVDLDPGDLDAAVMVLWCLGRRGPRSAPLSSFAAVGMKVGAAPGHYGLETLTTTAHATGCSDGGRGCGCGADSGAEEDDEKEEEAAALESRLLDTFSRSSTRLLPRLSVRQLPLVCRAYVQLGRSDREILGAVADLMLEQWSGPGQALVSEWGQHHQGGTEGWQALAEHQHGALSNSDLLGTACQTLRATLRSGGVAAQLQLDCSDWSGVEEAEEEAEEEEEALHFEDSDSHGQGDRRGRGGGSSSGDSWHISEGVPGGGSCGGMGSRDALLSRLTRDGLAMMLWALASAGYAPPQLMQSAAVVAMRLFPPLPKERATEDLQLGGPAATFATHPPVTTTAAVGLGIGAQGQDSGAPGARQRSAVKREADVVKRSGAEPTPAEATAVVPTVPAAAVVAGARVSRWAAVILCAFAASDCYNALLYDRLLSYVMLKPSRLVPRRVAAVLWTCAVAGHYRRDVMEALCGQLRRNGGKLPPAHLTQASWAIAHLAAGLCLSWRNPSAAQLGALAPRITSRQAAVLLWSFAVQQLVAACQSRRNFSATIDLLLNQLAAAAAVEATDRDPRVSSSRNGNLAADARDSPEARQRAFQKDEEAEVEMCWSRGTDDELAQGLELSWHPTEATAPLTWASPMESPMEPGVALIAAEALALLLTNPNPAVRIRVETYLTAAMRDASPSITGAATSLTHGSVVCQLTTAWHRTLRRRHPQQAALAATVQQLGFHPRLLVTHGVFPLALPFAVQLTGAAAGEGPVVLLLAEASDFASNVLGQPLGLLFTTVQLMRERGWRVAVVVAQHFADLSQPSHRLTYVSQLLQSADVAVPRRWRRRQPRGR